MGYAKLIKNYSPIVSTTAPGFAPQIPTTAASATDANKPFLRADGTWSMPIGATYSTFSSSANGLVPKIPSTAASAPDAQRPYLRSDGTWSMPIGTTYGSLKNPNKVTFKVYSGTSTAVETTYDGSAAKTINLAATNAITGISRNGTTLTLTKANGSTSTFSQQDTWKANSSSSEGYVKSGANQANKVWKTNADGVPDWRTDDNTTYGLATTGGNGLVRQLPSSKGNEYCLSGNNQWVNRPTLKNGSYNDINLNFSLANSTTFDAGTFVLPEAGNYIILLQGAYAANENGRRELGLSTNGTSYMNAMASMNQKPTPGAISRCQLVYMGYFANATTLHALAFQDSGQALTCTIRYNYAKLT